MVVAATRWKAWTAGSALLACACFSASRQPARASSSSGTMPAALAVDAAAVDRIRGALWGVCVGDALSMPGELLCSFDDGCS